MIFKRYKLKVKIAKEKDGYGMDSLLIKGGEGMFSLVNNPVDSIFVNNGKELFIPGSAIKGGFSFFMEKYGKKEWINFLGLNNNELPQDKKKRSGMLIKDIYLKDISSDNLKKKLLPIERHAEDEFTRAILGSSKFNEERLFNTEFVGEIYIDYNEYNKNEINEIIEFLKEGMKYRLIPLGAGSNYTEFELAEA